MISSRDFYLEDELLPPIEILKGFQKGHDRSCFHLRKLIIAALIKVLGSGDRKFQEAAMKQSPKEMMGFDPRWVSKSGKEIDGIPFLFFLNCC